VAVLALAFALLEGCYYMQAFTGQMEVLRKRRPVSEVITDDNTDEELRRRLEMVQEARQFAIDELLLPDNDSYRSYTDLERDYVVWNVFAAPEFSLTPKQWCYPVAGCVSYRGYFAENKADKKARQLEQDGYDVLVGGVAAYSTLGRFDDPILNTMMLWSDANLIRTLFHELAHQKLYVSGDTAFNESFASAVAAIGIERWQDGRSLKLSNDTTEKYGELLQTVQRLVTQATADLEVIYSSEATLDDMRIQKKTVLDDLSAEAQAEIDDSELDVDNWLAPPLNNAHLTSTGVYTDNLPAFWQLLDTCENDLACFYESADELAALDFEQRHARLEELRAR
jgi:predicted aminopeptidase